VTTLHATGLPPAGAFHAMKPDPTLQDALPAELAGVRLTVFTGPRIDLEYAGIYDDVRRAFGTDWESLPAVDGRVDEARMGVAFGSRADERIEIFALRVPGLTTEDWRPLSDALPAAEWTAIDDQRITFRNTAGTNVGGPRGDTLFNIQGSPELLDAAVALLLPAP
jgi:hypothetical protein